MHYRNKSSHYTPTAQDIELRNAAKMGDYLCKQIDAWRQKQGLAPYTNKDLKTHSSHSHARGSDDDRRQIIADLISDDASPFKPEDEQGLSFMSDAALNEMRDQYLKGNSHTPVANRDDPAFRAMTAHSHGSAGADFHRRAQERRDACASIQGSQRTFVVANSDSSDDPAFKAMTEHNIGAVGYFQKKARG